MHVLYNAPYVRVEGILFSNISEDRNVIHPPKVPHTNPNMVTKAPLLKKKDFFDYFGCALPVVRVRVVHNYFGKITLYLISVHLIVSYC